jgi:N-acetylglucosaminyldiphosphoundecaprenol N-acetyl-beta-D-mannosaminyltransferase
MNIELLGIKVNTESKHEIIAQLEARIDSNQKTFIVTPYSEFFYRGFFDYDFKKILNKADFSLPDGIAVQWLSYFLNIPFRTKSFYSKALEVNWQMIYSGASILLNPSKVREVIKEKISGADFFWDLCEIANKKNLSIFLLGGFGETGKIVAEKVKARFPNVKIAGISNSSPSDVNLLDQINQSNADILMVAFGPVRQEKWINKNYDQLKVKVVIGLGGTFDYVAGIKKQPPRWIRSIGLEWLFRLITQPTRIKRIWNGTFGLIRGAMRHKLYMSTPFRPNVVGVIINQQNQIFVGQRTLRHTSDNPYGGIHWQFPQGGVDLREDPDLAVMREMREEINTQALTVLGKSEKKNSYLWNNTLRRIWFNHLKFKGQEQTLYYLRYTGDDSDIVLDQTEFIKYRWVNIEDLPNIIHPLRRDLLNIVLEEIHQYVRN